MLTPIKSCFCNQSFVLASSLLLNCTGAIPNRSLIDCQYTACRNKTLVCPQDNNCTIDCYDSRPYACFEANFLCPMRNGDCTINCDDSAVRCSGDNCILHCRQLESCYLAMECSSGNCSVNCGTPIWSQQYKYSCRRSSVTCSSNGRCSV